MTKTNKKSDTNVFYIAAKTESAAYDAITAAVLGETKAIGASQTALKALAGYLINSAGGSLFDENGSVRHAFGKAFKANYVNNIIPKADPGMKVTLENQIGVYKRRVLLYAANIAKSKGMKLTNSQSEELHRIQKAYGPKAPKGPVKPRGYKQRMGEDLSAAYKFHMSKESDHGVGPMAVATIGTALETALKALGINPASVIAEKD